MSYDKVKDGIAARLKVLGLTESPEIVSFENASAMQYGNTFILNALSGEMDSAQSETIVDRFYDIQQWQLQVAFARSAHNDLIQRDETHRKKDAILADIDNPANWTSFVRTLKYNSWVVDALENYFVLTINLMIEDKYTY